MVLSAEPFLPWESVDQLSMCIEIKQLTFCELVLWRWSREGPKGLIRKVNSWKKKLLQRNIVEKHLFSYHLIKEFSFFTCKCVSAKGLSWQYPSIVTLGGPLYRLTTFSNGSPPALSGSGEGVSRSWRLDHLLRYPSLLPWLWVVVDICLCGSHISGSQTSLNIRITCERSLQIYSWAVLPRGSSISVQGGI